MERVMTNDDKIAQLERRLEELEGYLSQFDSFRNFRKRDTRNNTAAISTTLRQPSKTTNTRGSRLQEDWQPNNTLIEWAKTDYPYVDLTLEIAKFVDYWVARADKGAIKLDWDRTFRNWIRNSSSNYRRKYETHKRPDSLDFTDAVRNSFD